MQNVMGGFILDAAKQDVCDSCKGTGEKTETIRVPGEVHVEEVLCRASGCVAGRFFAVHRACKGSGCDVCWNDNNKAFIDCDCGGVETCPRCKGTNKLPLRGRQLCNKCNGHGCQSCENTGRYIRSCRICKGTGIYKRKVQDYSTKQVKQKLPCFSCGGTGHKPKEMGGIFEAAGMFPSQVDNLVSSN